MINPMNLTGKHIIITGASQGIGRETAILFSKLGAKVSLIARNEEKLKETSHMLEGVGHVIYPFNLKEISRIEELVKEIVQKNDIVSGLVHCAGIAIMRPLAMTNNDILHEMMLINLYAFIELVRTISKKKNHGSNTSIVGISSVAANSGMKSLVAYCSSKSAMDGAVRALAKELSEKGIRVNTIIPGFINTEMYDNYNDTSGENNVEKIISKQFLGIGETIDIANAAAYLLCDASKFITGTSFVVDGGYLS